MYGRSFVCERVCAWRLDLVVKFEPHPGTSQKNLASLARRFPEATRIAEDATCLLLPGALRSTGTGGGTCVAWPAPFPFPSPFSCADPEMLSVPGTERVLTGWECAGRGTPPRYNTPALFPPVPVSGAPGAGDVPPGVPVVEFERMGMCIDNMNAGMGVLALWPLLGGPPSVRAWCWCGRGGGNCPGAPPCSALLGLLGSA
jgi:hypothetical protein